jgi:hypothetical protein
MVQTRSGEAVLLGRYSTTLVTLGDALLNRKRALGIHPAVVIFSDDLQACGENPSPSRACALVPTFAALLERVHKNCLPVLSVLGRLGPAKGVKGLTREGSCLAATGRIPPCCGFVRVSTKRWNDNKSVVHIPTSSFRSREEPTVVWK